MRATADDICSGTFVVVRKSWRPLLIQEIVTFCHCIKRNICYFILIHLDLKVMNLWRLSIKLVDHQLNFSWCCIFLSQTLSWWVNFLNANSNDITVGLGAKVDGLSYISFTFCMIHSHNFLLSCTWEFPCTSLFLHYQTSISRINLCLVNKLDYFCVSVSVSIAGFAVIHLWHT